MRVVIAEDLALLRDGLTRLLEAYDFEVVAAVDDAEKLAEVLRAGDVDIAVVDVRMPPTFTDEGLWAAITARTERPGFPVLVLSQYVEQLYARSATCSRTASPMSRPSSMPCVRSPAVARCSIPRSSRR